MKSGEYCNFCRITCQRKHHEHARKPLALQGLARQPSTRSPDVMLQILQDITAIQPYRRSARKTTRECPGGWQHASFPRLFCRLFAGTSAWRVEVQDALVAG